MIIHFNVIEYFILILKRPSFELVYAEKMDELFEIGSMSKNLGKGRLDATEKFFNWEATVQPLIKFYSKLAST